MAQAGYTPISLYYSTTAAAVPLAANLAAGELAINIVDGKLYYENNSGVVTLLASAAGSLGDVVGPASATDNALARFDLTTGKLIQNSVGILSDAGILTGLTGITSSGSITFSSLTSGRVTFAGASGLLTDSANLTWNGTSLSATQIDITAQGTLRLQDTTGGEYVALRAPASLAGNYTLTFPADDGTNGQALITDGSGVLSWSTAASGDVYGPASATANGIALFDGTTGKLLKDSAASDGLIYGLTVGRGAGAVSTNTAVGASALSSNTTGSINTAIGSGALESNTTGTNNVSVGLQSLRLNTTGANNIASGYGALYANTTGGSNIGIGTDALAANTTASNNTAVGYQAGYSNTTGVGIVAVGRGALYSNTTGFGNVAVGDSPLNSNTTGTYNVAIGSYIAGGVTSPLVANTTGSFNIAIGSGALAANTTAGSNTAVGGKALFSSTGADNTAVGAFSLQTNSTGTSNVAVGKEALVSNTTASNNTAVGYQAGYANTTGYDITVVGKSAGYANTTGSYNTAYGAFALYSNTTGASNTAIGQGSLDVNTTGSNNVAVGRNAFGSSTTSDNNTAVGFEAGFSNTTGFEGVFFGTKAGFGVTTGRANVGVGYQTFTVNSVTGDYNTAIGGDSLQALSSGAWNFAGGKNALITHTTGNYNTAVGGGSLGSSTTASNNTAVGYGAASSLTTGPDNTIVGAGGSPNLTTGAGNVSLGDLAVVTTRIFNLTTENDRIIMGHNNIIAAYVKVAWTVTSDARDKMDFEPVPHGLAFARQIQPVAYYMRRSRDTDERSGRKRYGYKAQDILAVEGVNPVIIDDEQPEHLKYNGESMVPVLHNAIIEMADMIDQLKAEIAALKGA